MSFYYITSMSNNRNNKNKRPRNKLPKEPPALPKPTDAQDGTASSAMPPRRVLSAWLVVGMLLLLMAGLFFHKPAGELKNLDQLEFRRLVTEDKVDKVEMVREPNGITFLRGTSRTRPRSASASMSFPPKVWSSFYSRIRSPTPSSIIPASSARCCGSC